MHIIERLELSDLGSINRLLSKRGLKAKLADVDTDSIILRVTVIPPLPPKPTPLLDAPSAGAGNAADTTQNAPTSEAPQSEALLNVAPVITGYEQ